MQQTARPVSSWFGSIARVTAIGLLGCAACKEPASTSGASATSRIVGTWQLEPDLDPKLVAFKARMAATAARPDADVRKNEQLNEPDELPLRFNFTRDGQWVMDGSILGHPIHEVAT